MPTNFITAAIAHFGGGSDGRKQVGALLNVTTTRVYQFEEQGVVRKPEHAKKLATATGLPFEGFLIRPEPDEAPTPEPDTRETRRSTKRPKGSSPRGNSDAPLRAVPDPAQPGACLTASARVGRVVRPDNLARRQAIPPTSDLTFSEAGQDLSPLQRAA